MRASASPSSSPRTAGCGRWPTRSTCAPPSAGSDCGLLVDTWHFFRSDEPWSLLRSLDADQIALVHVNDAPAPERELVYESRFRRLPVGSGTFALPEFRTALAATGYDGVLSIEVLSSALRRLPPAEGARELLDSLQRIWPVDPARTVELN